MSTSDICVIILYYILKIIISPFIQVTHKGLGGIIEFTMPIFSGEISTEKSALRLMEEITGQAERLSS